MKPLHPLQNEDGIVLVTALIMVVILTVLMTGAYLTTSNELAISGNYKTAKQAMYQADAGVNYTIAQVEAGLKNDTLTLPTTAGNSVSLSFISPPTGYSFSCLTNLIMDSTNCYRFQVKGNAPNNSSSSATIEVTIKRDAAIKMAAFGDELMDMKSSSNFYSYDSTSESPPTNMTESTDLADVGSNGEVVSKNGTNIDGNVVLGNDGTDDAAFSDKSGTNLTGTETKVGPIDADPLDVNGAEYAAQFPYYDASNDNADVSGLGESINLGNPDPDVTLTSKSGGSNYYFTDISLGNSKKIFIDNSAGPVNIYVDGNITFNNGAELNIMNPTNPVNIYMTGEFDGKNGNIVNPGSSTNFALFSSTTGTMTLHNSVNFAGLIYSPYADIELKNSAAIYGAIWGSTITAHNSFTLFYDTALQNKYLSNDVMLSSWRNIRN